MRSTILILVGLLLLWTPPLRAEIAWQDNLRAAHQQAEQSGKLLLLHFYTDHCHWCDKLEAGAFQSPQLAAAIEAYYVPVRVHAGHHPELAKTFKVSRFPTDVIVAADGSVLGHGTSPQAAEDYIAMLARYERHAPAALEPATPNNTQLAARDPQPASPAAPVQNNPAAFVPGLPAGAAQPQINQFAVQAEQANAQPAGPQNSGRAAPAAAMPQATATAQLNLPAANPQVAPAPSLALPPMRSGTPAIAAGHRTDGMSLSMPLPSSPTESALAEPTAAGCCDVSGAGPAACDLNTAAAAAEQPTEDVASTKASEANEPPLAMEGYCPVAVLDEAQWVIGDPQYGLIHLGQLYLFSSASAMERFRNSPDTYAPVMNGMDVVLFFEERRLVQGSREWGVTDHEFNRIFFFASEETRDRFEREHIRYTRPAIAITRQAALEANQATR
ncbi:DUF255 domain-containing protein [Roseimaritima sediminicola]|uniref:DUF255 domain-containing protein n=1 Tax=Roseimaritima sediminicola TaxID=2662066 RepID=UPI001387403B|nr:DUF255 domain-containing protein [Roseimaritima sediminicola]